jgi:hypothetical protein
MNDKSEKFGNLNDEVIFYKVFSLLLNEIKKIFFIIFCLTTISLVYLLYVPNIYTSQVLLKPVEKNTAITQSNAISSIASISGFDIDKYADNSDEAIARIHSFNFFQELFLPNIKLEDLVAIKRWNNEDNTIIYKKNLYDSASSSWVRNSKSHQNKIPSDLEAYEFYKDILKIKKDKKTSFITISIDHHSPFIAKDWLHLIIKSINKSMQKDDKKLYEIYIEYLKNSLLESTFSEVNQATSALIEKQIYNLMLTSASESYVFKTIDSPFVPEEKSYPNRLLMLIICILLNIILSVLFVLIKYNKKIL